MRAEARLSKLERSIEVEARTRCSALCDRLLVVLTDSDRSRLVDHIAMCRTPHEWLDPCVSDLDLGAVIDKALEDDKANRLYLRLLALLGGDKEIGFAMKRRNFIPL